MNEPSTSVTLPTGVALASLAPGEPWFAEAVSLYLAALAHGPNETVAIISDFFTRYAALPDYQGRVALRDGRLVGFGFGALSQPGNWWHDNVAREVGADHPALQDAWVLVDLAVAPEVRRQGIGAALMETLLAAQPHPRALLSTQVANTTARRLYETHGWTYLHPGFTFTGGTEPYVIMRRELKR